MCPHSCVHGVESGRKWLYLGRRHQAAVHTLEGSRAIHNMAHMAGRQEAPRRQAYMKTRSEDLPMPHCPSLHSHLAIDQTYRPISVSRRAAVWRWRVLRWLARRTRRAYSGSSTPTPPGRHGKDDAPGQYTSQHNKARRNISKQARCAWQEKQSVSFLHLFVQQNKQSCSPLSLGSSAHTSSFPPQRLPSPSTSTRDGVPCRHPSAWLRVVPG